MPEANQQGEPYQFPKRQRTWGLVAIFAVYGTMSYFIQTLGIARPKIAADLDGMSLYSWSVSLPGLVGAFATLIYGKMSDIYGRRRMLVAAESVLLVGAVLCAFSPTAATLIAARTILSAGQGAIAPASP